MKEFIRHKEIEDESQRSGLLKTERGFKPLVNGLEYEIAVSGNLRSGGWVDSEKVLATPRAPEQSPGPTPVPTAVPLPDVSPAITRAESHDGLTEIYWTFDGDYGDSFPALTGWRVCHRADGENDAHCSAASPEKLESGDLTTWINELVNGKTYFIYVIPVFEGGREGNASDDFQVSLPKLTAPGEPQNVRVTRKNNRYILQWNPPENDGGTDIHSYLWRGGSQRRLAEVPFARYFNLDVTRYLAQTDDGVDRSQFYTFRVRAQNSEGRGPAATYTLRAHLFPPVIDSEVGRVEDEDSVVTVTWSAVEGAIKYRYKVREVSSGSKWSRWKNIPNSQKLSSGRRSSRWRIAPRWQGGHAS